MVPEMSGSSYNQMTRLIAREGFIEFSLPKLQIMQILQN
jgi:hypothetical protein